MNCQLEGGNEGILVDPGAYDNLTGSLWVERLERLLTKYHITVQKENMSRPMTVDGVGKSSEQAAECMKAPGAVVDIDGVRKQGSNARTDTMVMKASSC